MKNVMTMLLSFLLVLCMGFVSVASADKVDKMIYDSPTTNEDGTPLTDLAGFKGHCGIVSGTYTISHDAGLVNEIMLTTILDAQPDNTYYCAVTAYDVVGNESKYSDEVIVKKSVNYYDGNDTLGPAMPLNNKLQ
jgi:hypothetical protein